MSVYQNRTYCSETTCSNISCARNTRTINNDDWLTDQLPIVVQPFKQSTFCPGFLNHDRCVPTPDSLGG